ncbi:MAG: tetratricopeptide repeat protein [Hyphomicrobiaceae bacterium]
MRQSIRIVCLTALWLAAPGAMATENPHDCDNPVSSRRIAACTELIETPDLPPSRRASAFANRALSYSLSARYEEAIRDYDEAIKIHPNFAVALNNRAWAYFKWGKVAEALPDVERSLRLDPLSPHSLDTRAHIRQWQGDQDRALRDYEAAMLLGGSRMVALYQCGLKINQLYSGPHDGVIRPELRQAMRMCVARGSKCDPLPPDEECREATS